MPLLDRIFRRTAKPEERSVGIPSDLAFALGIHTSDRVTPAKAEALTAVCACVDAVCWLASLPVYVQRRTETGVIDLPNHPVARLLRRPNETQTQVDYLAWKLRQVLLYANALSIIDRDDAARPVALLPVPWDRVTVLSLPSGKIAYEIYDLDGQRRRYLAEEVLHIRDTSDDGIVGVPRLSRASQAVRNALELQGWATSMWTNAATPSGAIQIEGRLAPNQFDEIRSRLEHRHTGARNARSVLVLDGGAKWQPLSASPEDAEVLQSRKHATEDIARLFGVPSPIINQHDRSTFSNSETLIRFFAQSTLSWWARKLESSMERALLGSGSADVSILIDLSGLMRGAYEERWRVGIEAVKAGILDIDELREQEGLNKRPSPVLHDTNPAGAAAEVVR